MFHRKVSIFFFLAKLCLSDKFVIQGMNMQLLSPGDIFKRKPHQSIATQLKKNLERTLFILCPIIARAQHSIASYCHRIATNSCNLYPG